MARHHAHALLLAVRHPRHLDLTLKRQSRKAPTMPITILDYVKSVVGDKDLYTAEDCLAAASTSSAAARAATPPSRCYNAYPSTSGYWRCADCIGDDGYATVADFTAAERHRPARPAATPTTSARPASPPASAPKATRSNAATAASDLAAMNTVSAS